MCRLEFALDFRFLANLDSFLKFAFKIPCLRVRTLFWNGQAIPLFVLLA